VLALAPAALLEAAPAALDASAVPVGAPVTAAVVVGTKLDTAVAGSWISSAYPELFVR